ncbi:MULTISPECIES: methyltransferase domain-containing protein [unclassified Wenzhouxiangella]|uniref:methyltransferase domain-containing protein n=1 Tax=unclassified Wenzhouxiangella TaxID=2613841 RepID=UPI001C6E5BF5|nr:MULTISPECIES: methyltransferase domain-containing protein [unclassified Wenzhouxiangella]
MSQQKLALGLYDDSIKAASMMEGLSVLHEARLDQALHRVRASGARRVVDLGCGAGLLLHRLANEEQLEQVVGLESCPHTLAQARQLVAGHSRPPFPQLQLINGSYTESQPSLDDFDAAAMVETIEHINPGKLSAMERVVFEEMRPRVVYVTTPNSEYNCLYGLRPGEFRESDHKFEWDRARFGQWAQGVAQRNSYRVALEGIGEEDPDFGPPTQAACFSRID